MPAQIHQFCRLWCALVQPCPALHATREHPDLCSLAPCLQAEADVVELRPWRWVVQKIPAQLIRKPAGVNHRVAQQPLVIIPKQLSLNDSGDVGVALEDVLPSGDEALQLVLDINDALVKVDPVVPRVPTCHSTRI